MPVNVNASEIVNYMIPLSSYWYLSLPIGFFMIFGARYMEKIGMALLGFLLGINFVFPMLYEKIPAMQEYLAQENYKIIAMVVVGIITAALIYALYKFVVFIAGFLLLGAIGYYGFQLIVQYLDVVERIPYYTMITIVVAAVLGVIGGFAAFKKSEDTIVILSVIVGAATFSSVLMMLVGKYLLKVEDLQVFLKEPWVVGVVLVAIIIFAIIGFRISFSRKKAPQKA